MFSGYLGAGMLSAAVAGGVFASPPPASILAAILSLHNAGNARRGFAFVGSLGAGCVYILIDLRSIHLLKECTVKYCLNVTL